MERQEVDTCVNFIIDDIFDKKNHWPKMEAVTLLWFYSYDCRVPCGMMQPICTNRAVSFQGLDQMALMMEEVMDAAGYPPVEFPVGYSNKDASQDRYFTEKWSMINNIRHHYPVKGGKCFKRPVKAAVTVLYRKHGSMQGELRINHEKILFRSALELMCVLHKILEKTWCKDQEIELRNKK